MEYLFYENLLYSERLDTCQMIEFCFSFSKRAAQSVSI